MQEKQSYHSKFLQHIVNLKLQISRIETPKIIFVSSACVIGVAIILFMLTSGGSNAEQSSPIKVPIDVKKRKIENEKLEDVLKTIEKPKDSNNLSRIPCNAYSELTENPIVDVFLISEKNNWFCNSKQSWPSELSKITRFSYHYINATQISPNSLRCIYEYTKLQRKDTRRFAIVLTTDPKLTNVFLDLLEKVDKYLHNEIKLIVSIDNEDVVKIGGSWAEVINVSHFDPKKICERKDEILEMIGNRFPEIIESASLYFKQDLLITPEEYFDDPSLKKKVADKYPQFHLGFIGMEGSGKSTTARFFAKYSGKQDTMFESAKSGTSSYTNSITPLVISDHDESSGTKIFDTRGFSSNAQIYVISQLAEGQLKNNYEIDNYIDYEWPNSLRLYWDVFFGSNCASKRNEREAIHAFGVLISYETQHDELKGLIAKIKKKTQYFFVVVTKLPTNLPPTEKLKKFNEFKLYIGAGSNTMLLDGAEINGRIHLPVEKIIELNKMFRNIAGRMCRDKVNYK